MSATTTGRADDVIDSMLHRSRGLVLHAPIDDTSGEYDAWRQGFSRRDIRRLTGAGLIARDGMAADRLLHEFDGCHDMNADEFVEWWLREGLRGLDLRAARRAGSEVLERPESDYDDEHADSGAALSAVLADERVPSWVIDWCARTVHPPKLDALAQLAAARWLGWSTPAPIDAAWYPKLAAKFAARCKFGGAE